MITVLLLLVVFVAAIFAVLYYKKKQNKEDALPERPDNTTAHNPMFATDTPAEYDVLQSPPPVAPGAMYASIDDDAESAYAVSGVQTSAYIALCSLHATACQVSRHTRVRVGVRVRVRVRVGCQACGCLVKLLAWFLLMATTRSSVRVLGGVSANQPPIMRHTCRPWPRQCRASHTRNRRMKTQVPPRRVCTMP